MAIIKVTPQERTFIEGFDNRVWVEIDSSRGYGLGVVCRRFRVDENKRKPVYLLHKDSSFMLWMPMDTDEERPERWEDADVVWFWKYDEEVK